MPRYFLRSVCDYVPNTQRASPGRLTRFGFKTLERFFKSYGVKITVINHTRKEPREELVEDLFTITSHFAGKLYGMRSHKYAEVVRLRGFFVYYVCLHFIFR